MNQSIQCQCSRSTVLLPLLLIFLSIAKSTNAFDERQPLFVTIKSEIRRRPSTGSRIRFPNDAHRGDPFDGLDQQQGILFVDNKMIESISNCNHLSLCHFTWTQLRWIPAAATFRYLLLAAQTHNAHRPPPNNYRLFRVEFDWLGFGKHERKKKRSN